MTCKLLQVYDNDHVKENEDDKTCSTIGGEDKYI